MLEFGDQTQTKIDFVVAKVATRGVEQGNSLRKQQPNVLRRLKARYLS